MTESGEVLTKMEAGGGDAGKMEEEKNRVKRRCRRRLAWACGTCLAVIVILGIVALVLALTVYKIREPTATLVSTTSRGVAPRFSLAPLKLELNLTLDIVVMVHNPNRASFSHSGGRTVLTYQGIQVGTGEVLPGRVPADGSTKMYSQVNIDAAKFLESPAAAPELMKGQIGLNSTTRIPGKVTILGFIRRSAVAYSECEFVFSTSLTEPPKVLQQNCRQRTRL